MRKVVITGVGVVSPVGSGVEKFWSNLTSGRSGIGPITLFDASAFPIRIAGEVKDFELESITEQFPNSNGSGPKGFPRTGRGPGGGDRRKAIR